MPTYEYECTRCGRVFELFQSIMAKPKRKPDEPCAGCGERAPIRRLIGGGGAVIFKGSGFYETDYRSEGYKKAAKSEAESAKGASGEGKDTSTKSTDAKEGGTSDAKPAAAEKPAAETKKSKGDTPSRSAAKKSARK